jgi:hypothetical protein
MKKLKKLKRRLKSLQVGFKTLNAMFWEQQRDLDGLRETVAEHELLNLDADRVIDIEQQQTFSHPNLSHDS